MVEPIPGAPAAVADTGERALVIADYHAGIEIGLRADGVELRSRAEERREHLRSLIDEVDPDRVVFLGDLGHAIGTPTSEEREEVAGVLAAVQDRPVTVIRGNHDGDLDPLVAGEERVDVTRAHGARLGDVGFAHGHTWPAPDVLDASVVCVGHEHPTVRLEDSVGGRRVERAWLRGRLCPEPFREHYGEERPIDAGAELVVFPAFNDLAGGTWVNVQNEFLSPFLPEGLAGGQAYLLDGTRLGVFREV